MTFVKNDISEDNRQLFLQLSVINNSASLVFFFYLFLLLKNIKKNPEPKGSSTDIALLRFAENCSVDCENSRKTVEIITQYPFSSTRKRIGTVIKHQEIGRRLLERGFPEILLACSSQILSLESNTIVKLDEEKKNIILEAIKCY